MLPDLPCFNLSPAAGTYPAAECSVRNTLPSIDEIRRDGEPAADYGTSGAGESTGFWVALAAEERPVIGS